MSTMMRMTTRVPMPMYTRGTVATRTSHRRHRERESLRARTRGLRCARRARCYWYECCSASFASDLARAFSASASLPATSRPASACAYGDVPGLEIVVDALVSKCLPRTTDGGIPAEWAVRTPQRTPGVVGFVGSEPPVAHTTRTSTLRLSVRTYRKNKNPSSSTKPCSNCQGVGSASGPCTTRAGLQR
jgi:hypothetical protein